MKNFISKRLLPLFLSTTGFLVVLICWWFFSRSMNPLLLPGPGQVLTALRQLLVDGELQRNLLITVRRTLFGYGLAFMAGILTAIILNTNRLIYRIVRPLLTVIQTTPPVIWIALAVIWFGIAEDLTPVFLIFVVTLPVVFVNIYEGLQDLNPELIEMAEVYDWDRSQIYLHIYFPALLPALISTLSVGFAFAWKSTVFAEFIGSSSGIGFALSRANSNLETDKLFAWAIVLVVLMLVVEYLLIKPLRRQVAGWKNNG